MFVLQLVLVIFTVIYVQCEFTPFPIYYKPIRSDLCHHHNYYVADPNDCRIYYDCSGNEMRYRVCEENKYYHFGSGCLNYKPVGCPTSWEKPPPPTTTTESPFTTTESVATTTETAVIVTLNPEIQSRCQGKPNGFHFKVQGNCQSYALCYENKVYESKCPTGLSYSGDSSVCNISNNYLCEDGHICPPDGIHAFRKLGSCIEYHLCFAGVRMTKKCLEGLHFDASQNRCANPDVAFCNGCPAIDDPLTIVTYPSKNENEYFICKDAELVQFQCATDLRWNQPMQQCDFQQQLEEMDSEPEND